MTNWLKRLFGGSDSESDSSATTEPAAPATPPEPSVTPSEPAGETGTAEQAPASDEPA
jgi:hypothetical protein